MPPSFTATISNCGDGRVDEARVAEVVVVPDQLQQQYAREHLLRPPRELEQEPELGCGQRDLLAALSHCEPVRVDLEAARADRAAGLEGVDADDLLAGDAEEVHDRVEVGHVDRGLRLLLHDGFGVEGDPEARGRHECLLRDPQRPDAEDLGRRRIRVVRREQQVGQADCHCRERQGREATREGPRRDPAARTQLAAVAVAAGAALLTLGLQVKLPVKSGYAAICLIAAALTWFAGHLSRRVPLATHRSHTNSGER